MRIKSFVSPITNLRDSESDSIRISVNPNLLDSVFGRIRISRTRFSTNRNVVVDGSGRIRIQIGSKPNSRIWFGFGTYLLNILLTSLIGWESLSRLSLCFKKLLKYCVINFYLVSIHTIPRTDMPHEGYAGYPLSWVKMLRYPIPKPGHFNSWMHGVESENGGSLLVTIGNPRIDIIWQLSLRLISCQICLASASFDYVILEDNFELALLKTPHLDPWRCDQNFFSYVIYGSPLLLLKDSCPILLTSPLSTWWRDTWVALKKEQNIHPEILWIQAYYQYKNQSFHERIFRGISCKPVGLTNSRGFGFEHRFLIQMNWLTSTLISFKLKVVTDIENEIIRGRCDSQCSNF